jgi:hypothetical protein
MLVAQQFRGTFAEKLLLVQHLKSSQKSGERLSVVESIIKSGGVRLYVKMCFKIPLSQNFLHRYTF